MTVSSGNGACGPFETTLRVFWFFGCIIGGACLLYFGPRTPDNTVTAGIAMALIILGAPLAFVPINRKPKIKAP